MGNLCMRFPGGKPKTLTLSYDDAKIQDIRLMQIINKYGLKCTFNINAGLFTPETEEAKSKPSRRLTEREAIELYKNSGHEVAIHGYTHPSLDLLPDVDVVNEIMEDRKKLESMFGRVIRGMAYPYGVFNDRVVEILKNCGIAYSRTIHDDNSFEMPQDWLRLRDTCHHNCPNLAELADRFLRRKNFGRPMIFYLWGHSYEFDNDNNWNVIEEFAQKVSGKDDIWYATNIEIYDYVEAFKNLKFSADMSMVYNPSGEELFFTYNDKDYSVKPNETLKMA